MRPMYFDLNLGTKEDEPVVKKQKLDQADRLGFDCVIVNQTVESWAPHLERLQPSSSSIQNVLERQSMFKHWNHPRPLQLSRLTVKASDVASLAAQSGKVRRYFDIIAVQPESSNALRDACKHLDVDIIVIDISQPLTVTLTVKHLKAAMKRNVYFELLYRPAVRANDQNRSVFFAAAQMICKILRGRNVVLSSGASQASDLRGPYDIINFATLFGLKEEETKAAVSSRPMAVLRHALSRQESAGFKITQSVASSPIDVDPELKEEREGKRQKLSASPSQAQQQKGTGQDEDVIDLESSEDSASKAPRKDNSKSAELESSAAEILPQFLKGALGSSNKT